MRKISALILPVLFLCSTGWAEIVDRVVAVVGNEVITLSDVKKFNASRSANAKLSALPGPDATTNDPLDLLIREKILKLEMDRLGITVAEADLDAAVKDVLTRNSISMEALRAELTRKGMSYDQYRKDLGNQMKQMRFLSQVIFPRIKLTDEEVTQKAGPNPTETSRTNARIQLLQARSSEELVKYLDEARGKTFIEIKQ